MKRIWLSITILAIALGRSGAGVAAVPPGLLEEVAKLTAGDAAEGDQLGRSVAVAGEVALAGAPNDDDAGESSGAATVFVRDEGGADGWGEVKKLTAGDAGAGDEFGWAVALAGDLAAVGARFADGTGAVYLFARDQGGADQWGQVKKITALDAGAGDEFGYAVALAGDTLVVGARLDDDAGSSSGAAYVFERHHGGVDQWGQAAKLTADDGGTGDQLGRAVAVAGDLVAVGAPLDNDAGSDSGTVFLFARDQGGPGQWGQVRKLAAADTAADDRFGTAVAVAGDLLLVGAPGSDAAVLDTTVLDAGAAVLFARDQGGAGAWGEVTTLTASDAAAEDAFGTAVALVGETAAVGAPLDNDAVVNSGSAYVFARDQGGAGAWGEVKRLAAADAGANDELGAALAFDGDTLLVGAARDNDAGTDSGAAYVFGLFAPALTIAGQIPAVTGHAVAVPVHLETHGHALGGLAFSIDYDETCLGFDTTDANLDGVPDALVLQAPAHFGRTVFVDLGDADGELDVLLVAGDPAGAPLAAGDVATLTFTAACVPAVGTSIEAPVLFSAAPAPSLGDVLGQAVPATVISGSVEIQNVLVGDCDGNAAFDADDLAACGSEIFDGDGDFWLDVPGGTFAGVPEGCDSNGDTSVDAGDLATKAVILAGGTCGGPPAGGGPPRLRALVPATAAGQPFTLFIALWPGSALASGAFSIDLDLARVAFDATDGDLDGLPDSIRFAVVGGALRAASFDAADTDGELDLALTTAPGDVLLAGILVEVDLTALVTLNTAAGLGVAFSSLPAPTFGDTSCNRLAGSGGTAEVLIFADGFESGGTASWSATVP